VLPAAILGGLVSGAVSVLLPKLLGASSGWSVKLSRLFGWVKLGYVRAAGGAVFGIAVSAAIGLSTSNEPHQTMTYIAWYGLAFLGLAVVIAATVLIDQRTASATHPEFPFRPGDLARQHTSLGAVQPGRVYGGAAIGAEIRRQQAVRERAPQLSLGTVHIPRHSQRVELGDDVWDAVTGRVLRVPVVNAAGCETAKSVQALLTFMPDDTTGQWSPRDPAPAEWDTEPAVTALDIPGNGQPQLFDVAFVLDAEHVCVHQWTRHSREAKLHGYGIAGRGVIRVEVRGEGQGATTPSITDTLHIEALDGLLNAQWESEGLGTRRNWAPWPNPPRLGPPPGT
jgi:hypothetical protein